MPFLLLLKPFWPLIWRGLAAVAVVLFVWWAWGHYVAEPYREQGRAEERPKTAAAVKANDDLRRSIDTANKAAAVRSSVARAKIAALKAKEASAEVEITKLQALAVGVPAPTKEADCAETNKLIDAVIAERLRNNGPDNGSAPSAVP